MELIRGVHNLRARHHGCVATIGNFDGVHLGHQRVIRVTVDKARELGVPSLAVLFEPQPMEFFSSEPKPRITRLREKLLAMRQTQLERVLCVRFDKAFAALGAQAFIDSLLVARLGVRHLVVGPDFRFGKGRAGNVAMLQAAGGPAGFSVSQLESLVVASRRVSSTVVRDALNNADFAAAKLLLGRPYAIAGRVAHGDARGRTLGFPTLNLRLHRRSACLRGVFLVCVKGIGAAELPGVANIGRRPTVGGTEVVLEVHLLDFTGDLYGRYVEVEFHHRLRDERKFASLDALRQQIDRDVIDARQYLAMPDRSP